MAPYPNTDAWWGASDTQECINPNGRGEQSEELLQYKGMPRKEFNDKLVKLDSEQTVKDSLSQLLKKHGHYRHIAKPGLNSRILRAVAQIHADKIGHHSRVLEQVAELLNATQISTVDGHTTVVGQLIGDPVSTKSDTMLALLEDATTVRTDAAVTWDCH